MNIENGRAGISHRHSAFCSSDVFAGLSRSSKVVLTAQQKQRDSFLRPAHRERQVHGTAAVEDHCRWQRRCRKATPKKGQGHLSPSAAKDQAIATCESFLVQQVLGKALEVRRRGSVGEALWVAIIAGPGLAKDL